jgi:hypothetical protein
MRQRLVLSLVSTKETDFQTVSTKAGESALSGALVGGALPLGFAAAKGVVSPFLSNIIAQTRRLGASSGRAGDCRKWGGIG